MLTFWAICLSCERFCLEDTVTLANPQRLFWLLLQALLTNGSHAEQYHGSLCHTEVAHTVMQLCLLSV